VLLRLDREQLQLIEEAAETTGLNRTAWMRSVLVRNARHEVAAARARLQEAEARSSGPVEDTAAMTEEFKHLAREWKQDTAFESSLTRLALHPAYQRIIGLGRRALPLILTELRREPDHWFWALRSISGENPVPPEQVGDVEAMRRLWLDWGRQQGHC
jgi:uncharacterized protein (DUF1778 family)